MNPIFMTDGYKLSHDKMYPQGTEKVNSNFTPRSNKHAPLGWDGNKIEKVVSFGQQMTVMYIDSLFQEEFFKRPKQSVMDEIKKEFETYLGQPYDVSKFEELYDLGYLPLEIKALPEGTLVGIGIPVLIVENTDSRFYWLTNYLETLISQILWKPITSATIAFEYRKMIEHFVKETDEGSLSAVDFMAHDFSARGLDPFTSVTSGMGHALSFSGSDTLGVISGVRGFYHEEGGVIYSVPASEHSVMCAGGKEDEVETFRRIMKAYPTGIVSIVSDTWDLWHVCTNILPQLKEEITARDGRIVIRPDSGDPADIVCGTNSEFNSAYTREEILHPSYKGVVELLWDVFGGTVNEQGYKVLDSHIGVIYGDSITLTIGKEIFSRLMNKKFAATNVVLGVGSYTYQYNTRDTFGFAMKATNVMIDGKDISIFKNPVTDSGVKKSAVGLLMVSKDVNGDYELRQEVSRTSYNLGYMRTIYKNGTFQNHDKWSDIKNRLKLNLY